MSDLRCLECNLFEKMDVHPSGLCFGCYQTYKQRLRDGEVMGSE